MQSSLSGRKIDTLAGTRGDTLEYSTDSVTLGEMLTSRASVSGDTVALRFLRADGFAEPATYLELHERSLAVAGLLRAHGVHPGDRVLLAIPPGLGYVTAFFGCLYAGCVAVPAYPPRGSRYDERLAAVAADARPALAIGTADTVARARRGGTLTTTPWLAVEDAATADPLLRAVRAEPADLAFLQYTSGSTGSPKGVMVPHRAVLANLAMISANFGLTADDSAMSWLPPYHDMGLVGGVLTPIYAGIPCLLMSPTSFAQDPGGWLDAMARSGATVSGGPDFAYRLCADRIAPERSAGWDLSRWRLAFLGAEPVRAQTLRRFADRFAGNGFRAQALHPCYGLAEATLIVSGATIGDPIGLREREDAAPLVASGAPLCPVRVADPVNGEDVPPGEAGEIWVAGPAVADGYWARPEETARTFGDWLRTGDLGMLVDGALFVTGRAKDLIIVRGRNLYPQDIEEQVVSAHPLLHGQTAAAFALDGGDGEALGIVVEVDRHADTRALAAALDAARQAVVEACGVNPSVLAPVRRGGLPRTSSGKVQRAETRRMHIAGLLTAVGVRPAAAATGKGPLHSLAASLLGTDVPSDVPLTRLGLDSLQATQLVAAAAEIGVAVDLERLLQGATLDEAAAADLPHLVTLDLQRAFWLHEQLHPGTAAYAMAAALRLTPEVEPDRLDAALRSLLARHAVLRSRIGVAGATVFDPVPPRLLRVVPAVAPGELDARLTDLCRPAPQLANGDLIRATLVPVIGSAPVLLLVAHHAVADARSLELLAEQLEAAYAGRLADAAEVAPAKVRVPGRDEDRQWWRQRLAGAGDRAEFPTDLPPPARETGHGRAVRHDLHCDGSALAAECAVTRFTALLTAAAVLCARHIGGADVVLGVPVSARDSATADAVGYLVRVVPVRVDLTDAISVRDAVARTRDDFAATLARSSLPLDELMALAGGRRSLFDLAIVDDGDPTLPGGELISARLEVDRGGAAFPLTLIVQGGRLSVEYATDRYTETTAAALAERLDTLLDAMTRFPDAPWPTLPMHRAEAAAESAPPQSGPLLLHQLVWAQAERTPDAVAVTDAGTSWTYARLRAEAAAVTARLRQNGIGTGDRVGLLLPRSAGMIAAMLGVLGAGAAYVPLDPSYPAERNEAILGDAGTAAVLTELPAPASPDADPAVVAPDDAAYICYTSGSTGTPKGVVVEHRHCATSTAARIAFYGEPVGRFLLLSSPAFDSSVAGIYWTLTTGGTLVIPPPGTERDPAAAWQLITAERITHTLTLPSVWAAITEAGATLGGRDVLRTVIVAGEECSPDVLRRHTSTVPACALVNEYGPTEATVWATAHIVAPGDGTADVPIGRPIPGMACHVLDPWGNAVPPGVPGELHLGGPQLARGYHGRPDETAARFVDDSVRGRLYRTGDRVSRRPDGLLRFHGRVDNQLKIRGHRVEPGEVEAVLASHPEVAGCAVTADATGSRLLAYVVPRDGGDVEKLRDWLAQRVPAAFVPAAVYAVGALPRTPNGKIDRSALREPTRDRDRGRPPAPGWEEMVARAFVEVLDRTGVAATDDFFDLGGHSLAAARLAARLTALSGTVVPVADVFAAPTVAELAARLGQRRVAATPIQRQVRRAA